MELFPTTTGKMEVLDAIKRHLGFSTKGGSEPTLDAILTAFAQRPGLSNPRFASFGTAKSYGLEARACFPERSRQARSPDHCNGVPEGFEKVTGGEACPALNVLAVPRGTVAMVGQAPVVLPSGCDGVIADFSSGYARLLQAYDWDFARALDGAKRIPGDALVLCDDVWPPNYSHWLLDELPRLAWLGARRDLSLIVSAPMQEFQCDTLRRLGFSRDRIVPIADFSAVQADRLLVTSDLPDMPHPAFKGASWALEWLRSSLPYPVPWLPARRKFYVSRQDARGRHIRNEEALMRLLRRRGYDCLTLKGRSITEQAFLFGAATHIVSLHGAALANVAFASPDAQVIELFPKGYGTPAYYVIAGAIGCGHATYVADGVVQDQKDRDQIFDAFLDLDHFARVCDHIL